MTAVCSTPTAHLGTFKARMVNLGFGNPDILDVSLTQDIRMTGRGNTNEVLLMAAVNVGGDNATIELQSMTLSLDGTTALQDVTMLKVYSTGNVAAFDGRNLQNATLLG
ncbi:MAG: hypothetical protein J5799_00425, partial [Bacteroidales bacterium]|nr:hypothetical protein [Bacteroidales bacterium]